MYNLLVSAETLHGKTQCFVPRLPPKTKLIQHSWPLQCVLQHHVANLHLSTDMATQHGNIHAATPLRSATPDSKSLYTSAHTHTRSQSSLKPQFPSGKQNVKTTAAAPAAHEVPSFHRRLQPLYTEKTQCFVPRLPPKNEAHATSTHPSLASLQFCAEKYHTALLSYCLL